MVTSTVRQIVGAPSLTDLLSAYRASALKRIAKATFGKPPAGGKQEQIEMLADRLAQPSHVAAALAALDAPARAVLERIHRIGKAVDWYTLSAVLVEDGVTDAPRTGSRHGYRTTDPDGGHPGAPDSLIFQDVLARLELAGLVLGLEPMSGSGSKIDFGSALSYVVPSEVAPHLPEPEPYAASTEPVLERELPADPDAYSRELYFVWSYVKTNRPKLLVTKGTLSKHDMRELEALLPYSFDVRAAKSEADVPRLFSSRLTLEQLGLVRGGPVLEADEEIARRFWSAPIANRMALCLAVLLRAWWVNELESLHGVNWSPMPGDSREEAPRGVMAARKAVVDEIGRLGVAGRWVSLGDLSAALWLNDPAFLNPGSRALYGYAYGSSSALASRYDRHCNAYGWEYSPLDDTREAWQRVEAQFAGIVVLALHRVGLLDISTDVDGFVTAFRLGAAARSVLSGEPLHEESPRAAARIIVQPNFRIVALGQLPEITLMDLDRVADRLSADRAVEYELTRASVYRGQRAGVSAARLIDWLGEIAAEPVPQNVVRSLEQWQEHHERIVIRVRAGLLQSADPELLAELTQAGGGALRSLSPGFAHIAEEDGLHALLASHGLRPTVRNAASGVAGAALDNDGYVSFRQRIPDVYLLGRVQRLAEWDDERAAWRLTRSAVRRARSQFGMDAAEQVESWGRVLTGEPPEWLEKRIKAWGGFIGDATLHRSVLLEMPSDSALQELLDDPAWRDRLQRFEHKGPLVSVAESDLEDLRTLLADFGVDIVEE